MAPFSLNAHDRREEAIRAHRLHDQEGRHHHDRQRDGPHQVGHRREVPAAGVESADHDVDQRDHPDGPQRQAIGAGLGRMESLFGKVVVYRRECVEREDGPAPDDTGPARCSNPTLEQDQNGPEAEQGHGETLDWLGHRSFLLMRYFKTYSFE